MQQESELLSQHDRRNLFKYINKNLGYINNLSVEIKLSDDSKSNDSTTMLRAFSNEFSSNFNVPTIASSCPAGIADGLRFSSNIEDVRRLLATTPNTAAGEDGIPGKVLKLLSCELAELLNIIFQWSIGEPIFPAAWKNIIVQPIFKSKGDKSSTTSYCPISICATLGKVLERLIKEQ